ncbi:MAG TPA: multidrug transporter [Verrucomicrobiae bacterium]|jgi:hypothetical protein|nr:multidrug transporter [Verrucomicrobiae bacterium]
MKTKLLTALCALTLLSAATPAGAEEDKTLNALVDVSLVRPGCMVATIGGSALFLVCLPFAAMSRSIKKTAHTLVAVPAKAAFTRPVGEFSSLEN